MRCCDFCMLCVVHLQPANADPGVSKQELVAGLQHCMGATAAFADFCVPLLLEKMTSTLGSSKIDAFKTLVSTLRVTVMKRTCAPSESKVGHERGYPLVGGVWEGLSACQKTWEGLPPCWGAWERLPTCRRAWEGLPLALFAGEIWVWTFSWPRLDLWVGRMDPWMGSPMKEKFSLRYKILIKIEKFVRWPESWETSC